MLSIFRTLVVLLLATGPALADSYEGGPGTWGHHHMMDGPGAWFMGLFMMLFFVGLVVLGVWIILRVAGVGGRDERGGDTAREILRQRFAKGEIDRAEYEERMQALKG